MKSLEGAKRLVSRNVKRKILVFLPTILVGMLFSTSMAQAEVPWWHLTSGSRPTYLHAGAGKPGENEVQKVTVKATGGTFVLANLTSEEAKEGPFFCERINSEGEEEIRSVPNSEMQRDRRGSAGRAWKGSMVRGMSKSRVGQLHMPRFGIV